MKTIKKSWIIVISILALSGSLMLAGCSSGVNASTQKYFVDIDGKVEGGAISANITSCPAGTIITLTTNADDENALKNLSVTQTDGTKVNCTITGDAGKFSFTMPASDVFVTGEFEDVSLREINHYSVTIAEMPDGRILSDYPIYPAGATVTLTIVPDHGYGFRNSYGGTDEAHKFADFSVKQTNGTKLTLSSEKPYTVVFTMPKSDVIVGGGFFEKINSTKLYYIDIPVVENGNIIGPSDGIIAGEEVSLYIIPSPGCHLESLLVTCFCDLHLGSMVSGSGSTYRFIMPAHDVIVTAKFAVGHSVNIDTAIENGTLRTKTTNCNAGTTVTVEIIPAANYKLKDINVTLTPESDPPVTVEVDGWGFTRTFTMPDSNVKISGEFDVRYKADEAAPGGDLTIHFLELGNKNVGDCVYINYGNLDIIIDAGSKQDSAAAIVKYLKKEDGKDHPYVDDSKIEYVIATHAHEDHIGAFNSYPTVKTAPPGVLDAFEIGTIIDFPKTNSTTATYNRYVATVERLVKAGTVHYTALQCYNEEYGAERIFDLGGGVKLEILYNYFYENYSKEENNYSVCVKLIDEKHDNQYIFTGDLEKEGEDRMVEYYKTNHGGLGLGKCALYKGGHHGSNTSSNEELMAEIAPDYICVCTCAGTTEYTTLVGGQFPTQNFINRVAPYTDKIFLTTQMNSYTNNTYESFNGNIILNIADANGKITVTGDGIQGNKKLRETDWFKANRTIPKNASQLWFD